MPARMIIAMLVALSLPTVFAQETAWDRYMDAARQPYEHQEPVSPEGNRFLMLKKGGGSDETAETTSINVVLNWFEELKRLVPTN